MIKNKFSLRRKLLFFWLGSMITVLVMGVGIFYFLHGSRLESEALKRIGVSFSILNSEIEAKKNILLQTSNVLAQQKSIISTISMIDTYQDIEDPRSQVFDPEKQKLARELTKFAQPIDLDLLLIHDSNSLLTSFYIKDHETGPKSGYLSFRDGEPVPFSTESGKDAFLEREMFPPPLDQVVIHNGNETPNLRLTGSPRGIVIEMFSDILQHIGDRSSRHVGMIHASYVFNDRLVREMSLQTGLEFAIVLPDGTRFGGLGGTLSTNGFLEAPVLAHQEDGVSVFHQVASEEYILGVTQLPLTEGPPALFVFGVKRAGLISGTASLEQTAVAVLLLIALVLIPAAAYYLNLTFTQPIENLLSVVEKLRKGSFAEPTSLTKGDELSILAKSFNSMSQAIEKREEALRESEERFRDFAESSADWLWETDEEHRFTFISDKNAFHRSTDLKSDNITGKRRVDLAQEDVARNPEKWKNHFADLTAHRSFKNFEYFIVTARGELREVSVRGKPIINEDGKFKGYRGVASDITAQKNTEKELLQHRDHLEELVVQRTDEVQKKAEELELALQSERKYSTLQRQFVSLVSHEYRTPLSIIDGTAQRIIRLKDKITPEQLVERSKTIRFAVERMVGLIDTMLYAARLDVGKIEMHIQPCKVRELVVEVCDRQSEISPSHDIHVDLESIPEHIDADPKLLEHIFTNLLSNAVKYAPDTPLIEVTGELKGDITLISIKDQGLGIPEDELSHMFERYFRAKTAQGIQGTGIGLSVCKEFVEMHGGSIELTSVEGEGSTFTVQLPTDGQSQRN